MDKNTLSNYGWIVIAVLVLSVMIALATPFGRFVADGFEATYTGFAHVANGEDGNKILQAAGMNGTANGGEQGETKTCGNDYHYSLFAKKELVCDICGADTSTATAPEDNTPSTPSKVIKYDIYYEDNSGDEFDLHMFYVFEDDLTKAEWYGSYLTVEMPCGCPVGSEWNFDLATQTVVCPCGTTSFSNPSAFTEVCNHESATQYTPNYDTTHSPVCDNCSEVLTEKITCEDANGDNTCDICNGDMECKHPSTYSQDNGDGTHTYFCNGCGSATITEGHMSKSGEGPCDICGGSIN